MARRRRIRFIQYPIVGIESAMAFIGARVVLAEHAREVRLNEAVIVDGFSGHLLLRDQEFRKASVLNARDGFAHLSGRETIVLPLVEDTVDSAVSKSEPLRNHDQFFPVVSHAPASLR